MFVSRLLLPALLVSLVRGNELTTKGELEGSEVTEMDNNLTRENKTEGTSLSNTTGAGDQTVAATEPSEQERSTNSSEEPSPTATIGPTHQKIPESTNPENTSYDDTVERKKNDELFHYDYKTLRIQGLLFALILFILGILILTCGRCRDASCCRKKTKRRAYNEATRL
ncbi:FXYD domain-containing ion transport regulator 5-like isoform X1 [Ambystoma mexicanum]|uniref:FXYD domain-containing ion transport regulator 5-like isoform X1 n=1 Tax=Ambystoma mexicanum TaxID=8296 RepID=UPI0037E83CEF